jgi:YVTN family beta-propeller protein
VEANPQPSSFHEVFAISTNEPSTAGTAMQIDVSGDSLIGEAATSAANAPNSGFNPTHAAIFPNNSRVFVATAASVFPGGVDAVASFAPAFQSTQARGLGAVGIIPLPVLAGQSSSIVSISETGNTVTVTLSAPLNNVTAGYSIAIAGVVIPNCSITAVPSCDPSAYNGTFAITTISGTTVQYVNSAGGLAAASGGTASIPAQPVFLNSTQNTAMYVANFNSNSVAAINTTSNVVTNSATVGTNPVSLAETPNAFKIYVANQGSNSVSSLNVTDLSSNTVVTASGAAFTGVNPVWVVARPDSQKVYVLTQGDGQLVTIDVDTDTVTSSLPVGVGANYIFYDPNLNRIYVTNPLTASVYVFSASGGPNDTPLLLAPSPLTIPGLTGSTKPFACATCGAVFPVSVTALADGSRFYVASYQCQGACATTTGVVPTVSVYDANSLTLKYPTAPPLTLLGSTPFAAGQFALPPVAGCATAPLYPALYSPSSTRFRVFAAAAVDSSRVYVSMCDAGAIAVINTTDSNANNSGPSQQPDTVVTDILAAPAANSATALQNPIFLFTGQ